MPFNISHAPVGLLGTLAQAAGEGQRRQQQKAFDLSLIQMSMQAQVEAAKAAAQSRAHQLQQAALADRQRLERRSTPIAQHVQSQQPRSNQQPRSARTDQLLPPTISNAQELDIIRKPFEEKRKNLAEQLTAGFMTTAEKTAIQKQIDALYADEAEAIGEWRLKGRGIFAPPETPGSGSITFSRVPDPDPQVQEIEEMARRSVSPDIAAKIGRPVPTQTVTWPAKTATPLSAVGPVRITTREEYDRLPSGTEYIAVDGRKKRKL